MNTASWMNEWIVSASCFYSTLMKMENKQRIYHKHLTAKCHSNFNLCKGHYLTNLTSAAGGGVKILFENELGVADFHLPNKSSILYVSECDIIAGNGYKRKLVRYRNVSDPFLRRTPLSFLSCIVLYNHLLSGSSWMSTLPHQMKLTIYYRFLPKKSPKQNFLFSLCFKGQQQFPGASVCGEDQTQWAVLPSGPEVCCVWPGSVSAASIWPDWGFTIHHSNSKLLRLVDLQFVRLNQNLHKEHTAHWSELYKKVISHTFSQ